MEDHKLQNIQVYKNLAWLNDLSDEEAASAFLDCCGSRRWARLMAESRPFSLLENLFAAAESNWYSLKPSDWLEAFAAHPKIGSGNPSGNQKTKAAEWSKGEQSGLETVAERDRLDLAAANRLYEEKFAFIFIVCATGKTSEEMLAICRARLGNSGATELRIAVEEQRKITEIRLTKLLEQ